MLVAGIHRRDCEPVLTGTAIGGAIVTVGLTLLVRWKPPAGTGMRRFIKANAIAGGSALVLRLLLGAYRPPLLVSQPKLLERLEALEIRRGWPKDEETLGMLIGEVDRKANSLRENLKGSLKTLEGHQTIEPEKLAELLEARELVTELALHLLSIQHPTPEAQRDFLAQADQRLPLHRQLERANSGYLFVRRFCYYDGSNWVAARPQTYWSSLGDCFYTWRTPQNEWRHRYNDYCERFDRIRPTNWDPYTPDED